MSNTAGSAAATSPGANITRGRKWLYRIGTLVLIPVVVLAGLELLLRVADYGYPTDFFQEVKVQGRDCLVPNPLFGRRFFPPALARAPAPVSMRAAKPPGTFRIFVFGESAAQGDPRPQFGASRYLEALLRERYPKQEFEVINTSMTAINSHVILPIARECARHEADLWILYMGNNEMVGPFGAATVFGGKALPAGLVRLSLAIQRTRSGQLLMSLAGKLRKDSAGLPQWGGMKMFTQNEVPPGAPGRERVYGNFRRNLEDILKAGAGASHGGRGPPRIVLSTMAVNLKDCPPFASVGPGRTASVAEFSSQGSAAAESEESYEKSRAAGAVAAQLRDYVKAVEHYRKAVQLRPQSAEGHFLLAECLLTLTNKADARQHFELARDYDTLPFRTDSRLNSILTNAAAQFGARGVVLCDAAAILAAASPAGIPGDDFFYEHVHFNEAGNYKLALAWAEEMAKVLPAAVRQGGAAEWATPEHCARRLGLTDWNRISILVEVIDRMREPPLSSQRNNSNRVASLQARMAALRENTRAGTTSETKAAYMAAVQQAPGDYMLREAFAEFLQESGERKEEIAQRQRICELTPGYYFSFLNLGQVLREERRFPESEAALREAARLSPDQIEVRLQLGAVCGLQNKVGEALREFERVRRLAPQDPRPLHFAGETLWRANRRRESVAMLREAVRVQPAYQEARYRLGEQLAQLGDIEEAARELQEVIRLNPDHAMAHFNLGVALAKMRRLDQALREFDEVLRIDPQNKPAMQFRQQVLLDMSRR